ncbi:uncharacterized protein CDV56_103251 [Aspergillus thermomutatus]|uniref:Uncharacterized protein n=1 Tax=Aspergillus thermomutatus TaxID=41047 RepID=A0A397HCG2_ASPTH|nr:uncharacterized protein CDV56_103251 [Aspergillus thermomutatus]RHZ58130.1 hypothetical protein CDV56_103251 [Aspergillus thermomutatus]
MVEKGHELPEDVQAGLEGAKLRPDLTPAQQLLGFEPRKGEREEPFVEWEASRPAGRLLGASYAKAAPDVAKMAFEERTRHKHQRQCQRQQHQQRPPPPPASPGPPPCLALKKRRGEEAIRRKAHQEVFRLMADRGVAAPEDIQAGLGAPKLRPDLTRAQLLRGKREEEKERRKEAKEALEAAKKAFEEADKAWCSADAAIQGSVR